MLELLYEDFIPREIVFCDIKLLLINMKNKVEIRCLIKFDLK